MVLHDAARDPIVVILPPGVFDQGIDCGVRPGGSRKYAT